MTKSYFRKILLLYAVTWIFLGAIGVYYGYQLAQNMPDIHGKLMTDEFISIEIKNKMDSLSTFTLIKSIINYSAIILGLISWVGLYLLWHPARLLFVASIVLSYFIVPVVSNVYSIDLNKGVLSEMIAQSNIPSFEPWSQLALVTMGLISGVLLTIIFSSLGNQLFNSNHVRKSR